MTLTERHAQAWTPQAEAALGRWKPVSSMKNRLLARVVVRTCRIWMQRANTLVIVGESAMQAARASGRGLVTFSNHVSLFDDPLLTSCISDAGWSDIRWIAADALNFFGSAVRAAVFNAGKCVPIVRGAGVDQPGMAFLIERLDAGEWVHIFPEGSRSRHPDGLLQTPLKTGLAELIRASSPMVLAFHHHGMREVLPVGRPLPRAGRKVELRFGAPVDSRAALAERSVEDITEWAQHELLTLQARRLS